MNGDRMDAVSVAAVPDLNPSVVASMAIAAAAVAILAIIVAVAALRIARRSNRDYRRIANADSDVVDVLLDRISEINAATRSVQELALLVHATRDDVAHSLRHVAVVRYDAFRDLSGRLSFSAALLDDAGDGVIFTSLHGRSETQSLVKGVSAGKVEGLSPEEEQAVKYALKGPES